VSRVRVLKPMPPPQTVLSAIDREAKVTMQRAREEIAPIVSQETPRKSGRMAEALRPRIGRVKTGYALTVGAPRGARHGNVTVNQVAIFVTRGTGLYREGPGGKHKIRAKNPLRRMKLPNGRWVWSVRGQHADHFITRIADMGTPRVERTAIDGAYAAARNVEAV